MFYIYLYPFAIADTGYGNKVAHMWLQENTQPIIYRSNLQQSNRRQTVHNSKFFSFIKSAKKLNAQENPIAGWFYGTNQDDSRLPFRNLLLL